MRRREWYLEKMLRLLMSHFTGALLAHSLGIDLPLNRQLFEQVYEIVDTQ